MKFWCLPTSNALLAPQLPSLPPRTDRDVTWRSPPPPPRLSRQQKLDRGVIVLKPKKNRTRKKVVVKQQVEKKEEQREVKEAESVRYAEDLNDYGPLVLACQRPVTPKRGDVKPARGAEVVHQQHLKVGASSYKSRVVEQKDNSLNNSSIDSRG